MLVYLLYALFFISCIVLVIAVLLQPGKTDAGALFTSNISSTAFGPRGTTTILSKMTIAAAAVFFISALLLAMPAITGNISVLQTTDTTETTAPVSTTDTNTAANTATNTAANAPENSTSNTNVVSNAPANTAANTEANTNANR